MLRILGRLLVGVLAAAGAIAVVVYMGHNVSTLLRVRAQERHAEQSAPNAAGSVERTGVLPQSLWESSGIAVSRRSPGVLWSHNDSGDNPILYAIDLSGRELARLRVPGARALDWEDVSLGPCPAPAAISRDCLYIGDVGDNGRRRATVDIYIIPEPDVSVDAPPRGATESAMRVSVRYPDGPHNSEALAVTADGSVYFFTKGEEGRILAYVISPEEVAVAAETNRGITARLATTMPLRPNGAIGRVVTGAEFSPSGSKLALRTYFEVFFFDRTPDGGFASSGPPCFLGTLDPQGEAVGFLDEETLVLTSESRPNRRGAIHTIRCR